MKKWLLILILLLFSTNVFGATKQYGEIRLTVVNRAPRIVSIELTPDEPYYDSILECKIVIDDEFPEKIVYDFSWYVNDVLQEENSETFAEINDNDVVRCEAIPTDNFGEEGLKKSTSIMVLEAPAHVKALKPILNVAGVDVSAKELREGISMTAITGMVTGKGGGSDLTVLFLLGVFALILLSLNLVRVAISIKRKFKFPRQD